MSDLQPCGCICDMCAEAMPGGHCFTPECQRGPVSPEQSRRWWAKQRPKRCAFGTMTKTPCREMATVEVRKPRSHEADDGGKLRYVWQPLCADHDNSAKHGQEKRPTKGFTIEAGVKRDD